MSFTRGRRRTYPVVAGRRFKRDVWVRRTSPDVVGARGGELYTIEREASTLSDTERAAVRQEKAAPLLESLCAWAADLELHTLPSGKLGTALAYLLKQWPKLVRYAEDGRVAIDTNLAEDARRNWLFAETVSGAKASAHLYSLVQTARANELEAYTYLRRLFTELPAAQTLEQIEALLPWKLQS
ncbi:MAG: IS66 family transposase [Steroidobacteraceae bacterium]